MRRISMFLDAHLLEKHREIAARSPIAAPARYVIPEEFDRIADEKSLGVTGNNESGAFDGEGAGCR